MTDEDTDPQLFVFDTSNAVLWGEEVAREGGVPVEVVPAPPGSSARCDLALACRAADVPDLVAVLQEQGVPFARWPPAG